jgi:hypothetical protein
MKCLRVYSTADGESHFHQVEIPPSSRQVHPKATAFEVSANYAATRIRFAYSRRARDIPQRLIARADEVIE